MKLSSEIAAAELNAKSRIADGRVTVKPVVRDEKAAAVMQESASRY